MTELSRSLITDCESFLGKHLKQKNDLVEIFQLYFVQNEVDRFEDVCFTGKYVNGLLRVLKNSEGMTEVTNLNQIKKDLSENLEKITSELSRICKNLPEESRNRIENKYLQLSRESLQELKFLVEDLDHLKKYINHLKREN